MGEPADALMLLGFVLVVMTITCHLPPAQQESLSRQVASLADLGLRVLGVARGVTRPGSLPEAHHDLALDGRRSPAPGDPVKLSLADFSAPAPRRRSPPPSA